MAERGGDATLGTRPRASLIDGAEFFSCGDFLRVEISPASPLLGAEDDAVLVPGTLNYIVGKASTGKTTLAIEIAGCMAEGRPVLGLKTPDAGVRVGFLELELPKRLLQSRVRKMVERYPQAALRVSVRWKPRGFDLVQPEWREAMCEWIREEHLAIVIIDSWARASSTDQNDQQALLLAIDRLVTDTDACLLALGHEMKPKGFGEGDDLDALRGDTRQRDAAAAVLRITRMGNGNRRRIRFAKTWAGVEPADVWFAITQDGGIREEDPPAGKKSRSVERLLTAMREKGQPVTIADIHSAMPERDRPNIDTVRVWMYRLLDEGRVRDAGKNPRQGNAVLYEVVEA